jgi:hypothetical protein
MTFCWLLFTSLTIQAQNDCETILNKATDEFNAGHFYGLSAVLKPCIDNKGFSKEQLVRAYQLLTQTYLILDDPMGAEQSYLELLGANPEYISNPSRDPIDVVYLSKKFTATPIFSWYSEVGANITSPYVIRDHKVFEGSHQQYKLRPGFTIGGGFIWNINNKLTVEAGGNIITSSFEYLEDKINIYDNLTMTESQFSVGIPVSLKYTFVRSHISPYVYTGVSANLRLSVNQNYVFQNITPSQDGNTPIIQSTERDLKINFRRDFLNRSVHIGAGAKLKYKLKYFFADVRYSFGLNNVVVNDYLIRKEGEKDSDLAAFTVGYIDDYFRLNQFTLTIGYINPWYKPRKLKHTRTRGVLRDVKKQNDEEAN